MPSSIFCFDPTTRDKQSKIRGIGRYLQILKENFPHWHFTNKLEIRNSKLEIFVNPFFNFLKPPLALNRIAKKQIAVIHDLIPLKYPDHFPGGLKGKINILLNKLALRNYDFVVTDSEASKKDIVRILEVKESKVKVIYPCLPQLFRQKSQSSKFKTQSQNLNLISKTLNPNPYPLTPNYCLYVGDATWNKNLVNLAKAVKIINLTCVFVGKVFSNQLSVTSKKTDSRLPITDDHSHPWQKELEQFFEIAKNDKRFLFLGYIPDEDLLKLYRNARCNLLVSRDEGFGFSYLEAAYQECPSVLADTPVLHEISNNKGVLFSNPEDPNNIANAIGEIYFNKELRNSKGTEAKKRCMYFNQSKFRQEFLRILE